MTPDQQGWLYWIVVVFGGLSAAAVVTAVAYWAFGEAVARQTRDPASNRLADTVCETAESNTDCKNDRR